MSKTADEVATEQAKKTDVAYIDTVAYINALVDTLVRHGVLTDSAVAEMQRSLQNDTLPEYYVSKADILTEAKTNASDVVVLDTKPAEPISVEPAVPEDTTPPAPSGHMTPEPQPETDPNA